MNLSLKPRIVVLVAGFALAMATLVTLPTAGPAGAHGSTERPASRAYTCRFEQPENPMCAAAWSANAQALYDWMEVNIGDVDGRHRELIPDGQLCSAGRSKYGAFDQPGAWPVTALRTDGSGLVDLVYQNTAPHSTAYYRVYITRQGFDARTDRLRWSDLELAFDSGPLDRAAKHTLRAPLPNRNVPAVLYIVWQRSDSTEAFYACSDVTIAGAPTSSTPDPTVLPTTTPPPITPSTTGTPSSSSATNTSASPNVGTEPTTATSTATPRTAATNPTTATNPTAATDPTASQPSTAATAATTRSPTPSTPPPGQTKAATPGATATEPADADQTAAGAINRSTVPPAPPEDDAAAAPVPVGAASDRSVDAQTALPSASDDAVEVPTLEPGSSDRVRGPVILALGGLVIGSLALFSAAWQWSDRLRRAMTSIR